MAKKPFFDQDLFTEQQIIGFDKQLRQRYGDGNPTSVWGNMSERQKEDAILALAAHVLLTQYGEEYDSSKDIILAVRKALRALRRVGEEKS